MEATPPDTLRSGRARGKSAYKAMFAEQAETAASKLSATDADLAELFGVTRRTIENWKAAHPEFCEALKRGKEAADDRIEKSLYSRATGYDFTERVIKTDAAGLREVTEYFKHAPPDVGAATRWLFNRRPRTWRAAPVETSAETPPPLKIVYMIEGDSGDGLTDEEWAEMKSGSRDG